MKIINYGNDQINFPTSFEDFTLSQFYKLQELTNKKNTMTEGVFALKSLGLLINKDYNYMLNLPDEIFNQMNELNKELNYTPVYTPKEVIVINGVNYVPKSDMNKTLQGEKVTISASNDNETDPEKIAFNILSILIRPGHTEINAEMGGKEIWKQDPLDADPFIINFRKEQFKEHLKACDALPTLNFFLNGNEKLSKTIKTSSATQSKTRKKRVKA
jgi:hypothetical protein